MIVTSVQTRRIGIVVAGLVLIAGACGGSATPDANAPAATTTTATQATSTTPAPTDDTTPSDATTTSEAIATTTTAEATDATPTLTADELCELLPLVEIGVVMNAQGDVTTFASPSETSTICLLSFFNGETTVDISVELMSSAGAAGFDEEAAFVASIFATDVFEIEGVGDRAAGFTTVPTYTLVLAGQSVVLIIGPSDEPYSPEQAGEIGRLVAAVLG